jgi:hypothetical protein
VHLDSKPSGGDIVCTHQNQSQSPPNLLYSGYWVSLPGIKRPVRGIDCLPLSSGRIKEIWELYLRCLSGFS